MPYLCTSTQPTTIILLQRIKKKIRHRRDSNPLLQTSSPVRSPLYHSATTLRRCTKYILIPVIIQCTIDEVKRYGTPNATKLMKMPVRDACVNANFSRNKTVTHVNVLHVGTFFRTVTVKNRSRQNDFLNVLHVGTVFITTGYSEEPFATERFPERFRLRNVCAGTISRTCKSDGTIS